MKERKTDLETANPFFLITLSIEQELFISLILGLFVFVWYNGNGAFNFNTAVIHIGGVGTEYTRENKSAVKLNFGVQLSLQTMIKNDDPAVHGQK